MRWSGVMGATLGAMLMLAAPAIADAPPRVLHGPDVAGTPQAGQTLRAVGADWRGQAPIEVEWSWLRCANREADDCRAIPGADSAAYRVTQADVGRRLRVRLTLSNFKGSAWTTSPDTDAVTAAPASSPPPVAAPAPPAMRPFPVIRIRGTLTRTGAKVSLLRVRAPKGAAITLRCFGPSCPVEKWARTASTTRIAPFQRRMRAGTKLVITVTKKDRIGKHTTFVIRKGRPPSRVDRCLDPGARKPTRCAAT